MRQVIMMMILLLQAAILLSCKYHLNRSWPKGMHREEIL